MPPFAWGLRAENLRYELVSSLHNYHYFTTQAVTVLSLQPQAYCNQSFALYPKSRRSTSVYTSFRYYSHEHTAVLVEDDELDPLLASIEIKALVRLEP